MFIKWISRIWKIFFINFKRVVSSISQSLVGLLSSRSQRSQAWPHNEQLDWLVNQLNLKDISGSFKTKMKRPTTPHSKQRDMHLFIKVIKSLNIHYMIVNYLGQNLEDIFGHFISLKFHEFLFLLPKYHSNMFRFFIILLQFKILCFS